MRRALGLALALALSGAARADVGAELAAQVHEHRLKNGMLWLAVRRPRAPVFAAYVRVRAGGADELPGHTGLAHLFEHMAFKGTQGLGTRDWAKERAVLARIAQVGDALAAERRRGPESEAAKVASLSKELAELQQQEHALVVGDAVSDLYARQGAVNLNASTDKDLTSYYVSLPRNRLELWATLDAQRLAGPVLREFYSERDVVMEERRMRVESEPGGALYEELMQSAFTESPYRFPTVGTMPDLQALSVSDALAFHKTFYVPSNMIGCVVGDVDFAELDALLDRTFGAIPTGPTPPAPPRAEAPQRAARRVELTFPAQPQLLIAFHKPAMPADDDYVFDVITGLLSTGRTSRLYRTLVTEQRLATSVGAYGAPGSRLDNLFVVSALPLAPHTVAEVEQGVWAELERLAHEPPSAAELEKVRNRLEADFAREISTNEGLASSLTYFQATEGNWRYMVEHRQHVAKVTPEQVSAVAARYFVRSNSTTAVLVPESRAVPAPDAGAPALDGGHR